MSGSDLVPKAEALLGFARRAGRLAIGSSAIEASLRKRRCRLLIFAQDASRWTVRHLASQAFRAGVPVVAFSTRNRLGQILGRGLVAAIGVDDPQFAASLRDTLASIPDARRISEEELFPRSRKPRRGRQGAK
ncbi:MAG: ribosomal L7Ae/L30e/S12e/Gadd45 family protein [candidate division KSB1 bacterium]|nr:ribosomal L7Ae/L30e/S12e/Gadd45 family protein [candidate division KSB1 bacterium]